MKRLEPASPEDTASIDLEAIRERLRDQDGPTYWRSLDELSNTPAFEQFLEKEFPRWTPVWEQAIDRRSVLKLMAASMALAGLTACGAQPPETIEPYVNMPEGMVPGLPRYYATASLIGGYAHGLLVQSREGRPVKIEGNPDHPATLGACDVFSQASVLSVYDPDRSDGVRRAGESSSIGALLTALEDKRAAWDANGGAGLCLLTDTVTSPSRAARIASMQQRWPNMRWFVHDASASNNAIAGAERATGRRLEPRYRFDRVSTICAFDADFMGSMPGFLRHARDFATRRKPTPESPEMSRFYAVESTPSLSGANADHRRHVSADDMPGVVAALAGALGIDTGGAETNAAVIDQQWIDAVAADLRSAGEGALVVAGDTLSPATHALVMAINERLGALGAGVVYQPPVAASDAAEPLAALVAAAYAGDVDTLICMDTNPLYSAPGDLAFVTAYDKIPLRVHYGAYYDETAQRSHWHVPATHALESWDDARAYDGSVSLVQPLIEPLHGGLSALQLLSAVKDGVVGDAHDLLVSEWRARGAFVERDWRRWLQTGVVDNTAFDTITPAITGDWRSALADDKAAGNDDDLLLQFRVDSAVWDGRYANNGWLQELPRPLTKLTWGQAALISPAFAERRGLKQGDMVRLAAGERAVELPVYVLPGQPDRAITVNLGYGRAAAGRIGNGVGESVYGLRGHATPWQRRGVTLEKTGREKALATTQHHHAMEGRDLIRAMSLDAFVQHPEFAQHEPPDVSLYPEPWPRGEPAKHQWGMSIDLNACIGCNACVTACQAENNIPVVGETEVLRGHDMHWIRIDRYFEGQPEAPSLIFQPVPCMHCENAPCEYVCPVEATQHSAEGLNEMVYNRCVGTRYCSQNCPYKVRRFNWFNYTDDNAAHPTPAPANNPDVTVRSRGVMEKCTYCVQRINAAKIDAAKTDAPNNGAIADGDIVTACQQACPTNAIVFGDIADPASRVSREKASPRDYSLLGDLNTRPRTTYKAAVRNPNPAIAKRADGFTETGHAAG